MAKHTSVWGIEIGQSALKALRCSLVNGEIVADAFDFIEYPKILSQPEADPEELVADAMRQLLERNDGFNEKVCISVPGQSGLAKFFKPPPVEVKKIADIVRYEARQQIPFDLSDVVWDYQLMPGSMVEDGYALESEVGLFAMKREQAYRQLAPFDAADVEVDSVQLAPLALYNMVAYDRFHERIDNEPFDADAPPSSSVLLSIGTDSSDLIITNGFRIWQRSMPIGGNHFTRQLTKDLKLTFAKAEHLKRNAREAVDPKLVFQTMRPVFNDLVTEVQRSIGFFRSIDKKAEISELLITGNTVKMPGLAAYLGKNLDFEVHVVDRFNRLGGDDVLAIPAFRDNAPTFAVCYGLCLQGLGLSQVHASLVPQEIMTARMIRAKKPWTIAGLAALMIGLATHYGFTEASWEKTHESLWKGAESAVTTMSNYHSEQLTEDEGLNSKLVYLNTLGKEVSGNAERRLMWLEIVQFINEILPREAYVNGKLPSPKDVPFEDRIDLYFHHFESKHYVDLAEWWDEEIATRYREETRDWMRATGQKVPEGFMEALMADTGPTGPGWVIQLHGYHYFNDPDRLGEIASNHIRKVLTDRFRRNTKISLPTGEVGPDGKPEMEEFTPAEMGLSYPILLDDRKPVVAQVPNPDFDPLAMMEAMTADGSEKKADGEDANDFEMVPPVLPVSKLEFVYQVVWQETVLSDRLEAKRLAAEAAAAAAEAAGEEVAPAAEDTPDTDGDVALNP
tara:strand:- start:45072 stop:47276 length:2205 start_codon:yes stop_codon:yes gene_type:complete